MFQFRSIGTISLIICLVFAALGSCATSKPGSGENRITGADFDVIAESVPQGILLTFSNIPPDASYLWIHANTWDETEEPISPHDIISSYAGITDTSVQGWVHSVRQLEKVKQTGKVIFPFVQAGQKYRISAMVYNQQEFRQMRDNFMPRTAETECIAENGIYFNSDFIKLELNKDNSAVTLSSEPVFSSALMFDNQKYTYSVTILVSENESVGVGDHHIPEGLSPDGLTWTFEPHMTAVNLKEIDWLVSGNHYSAWSQVYVNIIYDDILWSVEVAKTPEFTYSL